MKDVLVKRVVEKGVSLVRESGQQVRTSLRSALLRARAMGLGQQGHGPLPSPYGDRVWNPATPSSPVLD